MSVINTNVKSMIAQNSMKLNDRTLSTAMERLSTGVRINSAKDDAAGLSISTRMTSDIRGMSMAIRNANDGISLVQTAEGALGEVTNMLQRMRELSVQSANGTLNGQNRADIQAEVKQLIAEIDNIAGKTNFNSIKLLDGTASNIVLQTNVNAGDTVSVKIGEVSTASIGRGAVSSLSSTGSSGVKEASAVTFAAMTTGQSVTVAGLTYTSTTASTATEVASAFASLTSGASAGDGTKGTFSGVLDGFASGAKASATAVAVTFTATGLGDVTDITTSGLSSDGSTLTALSISTTDGTGSAGLDAGDLILNGVTVGGFNAAYDTVSSTANASSAIARAAAINAVSADSGVRAVVGNTVVAGSAMTAASLTGTITINGVSTASVSTISDATADRAAITTAINAISSQTGVRAVDTFSSKLGVQLIADDGRNVDVSFTTLTADATGVGSAATYSGTYTLESTTGGSITVGTSATGDITNAGVAAGAYASGTATLTSVARSVGATTVAPSTTTTGVLNDDTLTINGVAIGAALASDDTASDTTATSSTKAASAIAIAAAINKQTSVTGVTAKAEPNVVSGTSFSAGAVADLFINGTTINVSSLSSSSTVLDVANLINNFSSTTGVIASDNGRGLTLTAEDGRNISIGASASSAAKLGLPTDAVGGTTALAAATTYGKVSLSSDSAFTLAGGSEGNANFEKLGFKTGTFGASAGGKVADIDISTAAGATSALQVLDGALVAVSSSRADLGAIQNRLTSAVDNLASMSTNLSESRSRILDTDYATETTKLARSQIIQQAATAMLAQANQAPQSVLALLK